MTQSDKPTAVSQYIYDILNANPTKAQLGLADVWDGDETLIPQVPAACVIVGNYTRLLAGIPFMTDNNFEIFIMVYHGMIQDSQLNQRACMERAEAIMDYLHTDKTMGGNVVHGYVTGIEPGAVRVNNTLMFATRITWTGLTKTMT